DQILVHLLGRVGVPGGLLHRGPAAEVEVPSGQRSGAAGRRCALQHQNPRPRSSCADRCAAAPDTETNHHDVDIVRPRRHLVSAESCWYFSAHWRRSSSSLGPPRRCAAGGAPTASSPAGILRRSSASLRSASSLAGILRRSSASLRSASSLAGIL